MYKAFLIGGSSRDLIFSRDFTDVDIDEEDNQNDEEDEKLERFTELLDIDFYYNKVFTKGKCKKYNNSVKK